MTKKQFIQQIIIRALPEINNLSATIQYAEQLWDNMACYGYSAEKEAKPREAKDYYQALSDRQRVAFDQFWTAFKYKKDRNGAAMRWLQMGEINAEQYQKIIAAARQEALRPLTAGQSRKMAQGWLFERRYEDFTPDPVNEKKQQNLTLVHLKNELANLENLYQLSPNDAIATQIRILEAKINTFSTH
jgi:hypothetical protein